MSRAARVCFSLLALFFAVVGFVILTAPKEIPEAKAGPSSKVFHVERLNYYELVTYRDLEAGVVCYGFVGSNDSRSGAAISCVKVER